MTPKQITEAAIDLIVSNAESIAQCDFKVDGATEDEIEQVRDELERICARGFSVIEGETATEWRVTWDGDEGGGIPARNEAMGRGCLKEMGRGSRLETRQVATGPWRTVEEWKGE